MTANLENNLVKKYPLFFDYLKEYDGPIIPIQFGMECFPEKTLILGNENKNIEDFNVLDELYGKKGQQKIIKKFQKQYDGELIKINAAGMLPLYCTPEHPILTVSSNTKYRPTKIIDIYKKSSEILPKIRHKIGGDYLSLPILNGDDETTFLDITQFRKNQKSGVLKATTLNLDNDIAWFFGLYTAEGSTSNNGIQISLHENEITFVDKIKKIFNKMDYGVFVTPQKKSKGIVITITCKTLSRAFDYWCGHLAENKQIPNFILNNKNLEIMENFLNGYIDGDGSLYKSYKKVIGVKSNTISKTLALQLQLAYAKFGKFARISITNGGSQKIMNRVCETQTKYCLSVNDKINKDVLITDNRLLIPVRKIEKVQYNGDVYNFTTEDNTYLVNNIIVHNCGDGWYWLLDQLMGEIYGYCNSNDKKVPEVTQIKEKYGRLCIYIQGGDEMIDGMIWLAESMSYTICEECGSIESIGHTTGWIKTLCYHCSEKQDIDWEIDKNWRELNYIK